jgi:ferredoxin-type protein NapF
MWCIQICPLGYSFDLLRRLKRNGVKESVDHERRNFLVGVGIGIPASMMLSRLGRGEPPVLPPGAVSADQFGSVCSRCYACVNACPTHILRVDAPGRMRLIDWFQPEMKPNAGTCEEFCNACTQVCPTGAIRDLTEKEKRYRQIGVAEVIRHACLAWEDQEYCMVCDEYCPYNAIETEMSAQGIPQPVVIPDRCRGCGYCQNQCPAIRDGKAIIVRGIPEQKTLQPNDLYNY